MDKTQRLHAFFSSFAWKAYDENSVPEKIDDGDGNMIPLEPPYITYEVETDNIGTTVYLSASLWSRSTSWAAVEQKAKEIAEYVGYSGVTLPFDGGLLWVTQGSPFSQRLADDDDSIRRIMLNFAVEFISAV